MSIHPATSTDEEIGSPSNRYERLSSDPAVLALLRRASILGLVVLLVGAFLRVYALGVRPLKDPDLWWHLVMGHRFLEGTSIQHPGPISTFGTEDWRPRDWATQMLAALFDDWFGLPGVAWLYALGLVVFALVLYRAFRRFAGFATAAVLLPISVLAAQSSLTQRPQLVSFILLVVTVSAMLATADDLRPRWWLAPMTGLWACAHGLWLLSPVIQIAVITGMFLSRKLTRSSAAKLLSILAASIALVAVTPNGLPILRRPLGYATDHAHFVQEYQRPGLSESYFVASLAMLAVLAVVWLVRRQTSWVEFGLFCLAIVCTLYMRRTVTIGAVIAAILLARALGPILDRVRLEVSKRLEVGLVTTLSIGSLAAAAFTVPVTADEPSDLFPVSFAATLDALPEDAVVLNDLGYGGYLQWRHPDLKHTIDGLSDQYKSEYVVEHFEVLTSTEGWQELVEETGATHALLAEDSRLSQVLEQNGWRVLEQEGLIVLLVGPRG